MAPPWKLFAGHMISLGKELKAHMYALEVEGLRKVFPGRVPVVAVDGVSFRVERGEAVGLLGPNGAGKTTIVKCILGLIRATAGVTKVFQASTDTEPRRVLSMSAAVLEGSRNTYWRLTPWENVALFASLNGVSYRDRANRLYFEELLERFGLARYRDTQVGALSTGNKQKVSVVAILAKRTPLVFLDEPTLGLDVETTFELKSLLPDLVRDEGRTLVISSHNMDVVQAVCPRVIIVSRGRVLADAPVADLLELFRTRSYRLTISGSLSPAALDSLNTVGPVTDLVADGGQSRFTVQLQSEASLYQLIDVLRDEGVLLKGITQREPNLEQAFLELVRHGGIRE